MPRKAAKPDPQPLLFPGFDAAAPLRPMPATARPLFLPGLVREAAQSLAIVAAARDAAHVVYRKWAEDLKAGVLHQLNETQVEQDIFKGLFGALGYTTASAVSTGSGWTLAPKYHIPGDGIADAALGRFGPDAPGTPRVMVELKGAKVDLDRKSDGGRTPVQQVWEYLGYSETARWAIVTNGVELRLYSRDRSRNHVHRVSMADLADPDAFRDFYALFRAESLLDDLPTPDGTPRGKTAAELMEATNQRQEAVGGELYAFYSDQREALVGELLTRGVLDLDTRILTAQKLLDRVLFIAFAEDRGLIRSRTIKYCYEASVFNASPVVS